MRRSCFLLALVWACSICHAEVLPLSDLLGRAGAASAVEAVDAELAMLDALGRQREAEAGWQWFASAGAGRYHELVTEELRDDYYRKDLALGLRHPLLGSLHRQLAAVSAVKNERQRQQARRSLYKAQQRLALRTAYADWWRAQQEQDWCAAHADSAQRSRQQLADRLREGWLLASEARLLSIRWESLQRRCAGIERVLSETRYSLQTLSGQRIETWNQPEAEGLAAVAQPLNAWLDVLEMHPLLQERREQLRFAEQNRQSPWYAGIDSSFSVSQSYEDRNGGGRPGNGLVASLSLSTPFDPMSYGRARGDEGEARHQLAIAQLGAERQQLVQALGQALRAYREAANELHDVRQLLEAAAQALLEQTLRLEAGVNQAYVGKTGAELNHALLQARQIAAWHALWLRHAALQLFMDKGKQRALLGPLQLDWHTLAVLDHQAPVARSLEWQRGTYVWDSAPLLDARTRAGEFASLRDADIRRIYLGLSAAQLRAPEQLINQLQATLGEARRFGIDVLLLLGDPDWIPASGRQGLLNLLATLRSVPFSGLHLDLEVEQLGWPVPESRLHEWVDGLAEVAQISPWPLEISSHHRWFAAPQPGDYCVPCHLQERGVRQVSLMVYARNPERSATLAEDIARRWPALSFRLAQSVEPHLAVDETWSGMSREQLRVQEQSWRHRLQAAPISGVDWQDWSNFPY